MTAHNSIPSPRSFYAFHPNLEQYTRQARGRNLSSDLSIEPQRRQRAPDESRREVQKRLGAPLGFLRAARSQGASLQRLEAVVGQHKGAAVVGLEVINLFAEDGDPEVLAEELDRVQRVGAREEGEGRC